MVVWRAMDMSPIWLLLKRMGLDKKVAEYIFKKHIKSKYDYLVCSSVGIPFIINFDTVIQLRDDSDSE
jgi:hypothetical protein